MKRIRVLGAAALAVLMAAGCSESDDPTVVLDGSLLPATREVTLKVGEEKPLDGSVIYISFASVVEDSRCPVDATVQCVWEGRGVVELGLRAGMGPTEAVQVSTQAGYESATRNGLRITLLEFTPGPRWEPPIQTSEYQIKVRVESE